MIDNITQLQILTKLMLKDACSYSEAMPENTDQNLYNYHLKELIKKGFVTKNKEVYELTQKGRNFVSTLEEDSTVQKQFKVGVLVSLIRKGKSGNEMYLFKRLKHPHYGYVGAVSAKVKFGEKLEETIKRELFEELEIKPTKIDMLGNLRLIMRNEEEIVSGDGIFYEFVVTEFEGTPKEKSSEGEYFWWPLEKVLERNDIFKEAFERGIPHLKSYLENPKTYHPHIIEIDPKGLKY